MSQSIEITDGFAFIGGVVCSQCNSDEAARPVSFERDARGKTWVVEPNTENDPEYDGATLRTGPFESEERARKWFREELGREI